MRSLPEIFFFAIVFYILYRFIFNFVVPIARTTRQVKQQFRNMQDMHNQQNAYQEQANQANGYPGNGAYGGQARRPQATATEQQKPTSNGKGGEYIDFEEIK